MMESYIAVLTKGICQSEENGSFLSKDFDVRKAYLAGSIKGKKKTETHPRLFHPDDNKTPSQGQSLSSSVSPSFHMGCLQNIYVLCKTGRQLLHFLIGLEFSHRKADFCGVPFQKILTFIVLLEFVF